MNNKPNLFIAGVAKAGTTVLANYLSQHPEIFFSSTKEPNYYSALDLDSEKLYYQTKPIYLESEYLSLFNEGRDSKYRAEASVSYFFYPQSIQRIIDSSPDSKVILILRNPIDRAFSHYLMDKRLGYIDANFHQVLENKNDFLPYFKQYVEQGKYYINLIQFQDKFQDNLLVLEWKKDIRVHLDKICSFLDVGPFTIREVEANQSLVPKGRILQKLYSNAKLRRTLRSAIPGQLIQRIKSSSFEAQKDFLAQGSIEFLSSYYKEDLEKVKELTGFNLESLIKRQNGL